MRRPKAVDELFCMARVLGEELLESSGHGVEG